MIKLLLALLVVLALCCCDPEGVRDDESPSMAVRKGLTDSNYRIIDEELNIVCYVHSLSYQGGISCIDLELRKPCVEEGRDDK